MQNIKIIFQCKYLLENASGDTKEISSMYPHPLNDIILIRACKQRSSHKSYINLARTSRCELPNQDSSAAQSPIDIALRYTSASANLYMYIERAQLVARYTYMPSTPASPPRPPLLQFCAKRAGAACLQQLLAPG